MNITLTGNLGGGKTSVCKELKEMGFEIISGGTIFRDVANEKGVSLVELNAIAKNDPSIDKLIDDRTTRLGKELDNVVFDSRLAWHFAPDSFKVFMLTDPSEAARRVYEGTDRNAESYTSYEDALSKLYERANLERDRFLGLYNIDYFDKNNYNLIIESTNASPKDIAKEIVSSFEDFKKNPFKNKIELNTGCIYPQHALSNSSVSKECGLCLDLPTLKLSYKDGYIFVASNESEYTQYLASHPVFVQTSGFINTNEEISYLNETEYAEYEKKGDFKYRSLPQKGTIRPTYTIDLYL